MLFIVVYCPLFQKKSKWGREMVYKGCFQYQYTDFGHPNLGKPRFFKFLKLELP